MPNANEDNNVLLLKLRASSVHSVSKPSMIFRRLIHLSDEDFDASNALPRDVVHTPVEYLSVQNPSVL